MTEDEARKKWCPFVGYRPTANPLNPNTEKCMASDCACWVGEGGDSRGVRYGRCGLTHNAKA